MRITWLNGEMTQAHVARGRLWWKRVAHVRRVDDDEYANSTTSRRWRFVPSDRVPTAKLCGKLEQRRNIDDSDGIDAIDWHRPGTLPPAQVVTMPRLLTDGFDPIGDT